MSTLLYHKLLEKQIKKLLTDEQLAEETIRRFLEVVNSSYAGFERDKKISDHAFFISEKEYQAVTRHLQEQHDIRLQSIVKLKNAIRSLDPLYDVHFNEADDADVISVISFLEEQIQKTKELEVVKALHFLARVEAKLFNTVEPERRAGLGIEMPGDDLAHVGIELRAGLFYFVIDGGRGNSTHWGSGSP